MLPAPLRLFNPHAKDRAAVVTATPAGDAFTLTVTRGPSRTAQGKPESFGPFLEAQLESQWALVAGVMRSEGYLPAGLHAMLAALQDERFAVRAHAAARLGWRRERTAVDALIAALPNAVDDTCAILDALGAIGDPKAIPAVRPYTTRKLLSRRRSAVEALRVLGDADGLAAARGTTLEQMPPPVQAALNSSNVFTAIEALDAQYKGLALDTLYELSPPGSSATVQTLLQSLAFDRAYVWRYVKSILKRAMLRHDYAMFGWLHHEIEVRGHATRGTGATIKSGYDGAQRHVLIFGRKTQTHLRGAAWRWLKLLADYRPEAYAAAAAEMLIHYNPTDADRWGSLGGLPNAYVLQRILHGANPNLHLDSRRWRFGLRKLTPGPAGGRYVMYRELWESRPRAYLRVLGGAKLPEAHVFAVAAISDEHRRVLEDAPVEDVIPLLDAPYEPTLRLGLEELERRFDASNPDWAMIQRLLANAGALARNTALRWLGVTAALWGNEPARMADFLTIPDAETGIAVARLIVAHLSNSPAVRKALAAQLLVILRKPEPHSGVHDAVAIVAREALKGELAALLTVAELTTMLARGSAVVQAVAGTVLAAKPNALAELGIERVAALALHEVAAVRAAATAMLRGAIDYLKTDPTLLFVLAEAEWADTRDAVLTLIRNEIDLRKFGLDGFIGLIDSNRPDVQDHGRDLILRHLDELPVLDLLERLIQHPHPNVRKFALDIVVKHLPDDAESLAQTVPFCRAVLLDVWPSRAMKRRVLEFLAMRGLRDEEQATVAADLLGEIVRMRTRSDFERALEALARIQLTFPDVQTVILVQH